MFRRTKRIALIAASALLAIATGVSAQSPVTGTYTWEFEAMIRRGDAAATPESSQSKAKATLVITEVKADSIIGTFGTELPASMGMASRPAREIRGTVKGNTIQFSISGQARVNINGEERPIETTRIYTGVIEGDVIKITIETTSNDSSIQMNPQSFEGKRAKS